MPEVSMIVNGHAVYSAVEGQVVAEALAELTLKGFSRPVAVYNVMDAQQG